MKPCVEWEGLIAQSLYEALEPNEQRLLDNHLAQCSACSAEHTSLHQVMQLVPRDPIAFTGDLRRVLEEEVRLTEPSPAPLFSWFHPLKALSAVLVVAIAVFFYAKVLPHNTETPTAKLIAETTELVAQHEYTRAYILLNTNLNDPALAADLETAKVQGVLAELTFSRLRWYPDAHKAFNTLREDHPATYRASPDYINTFKILEESYKISPDYASLHDWDRLNTDMTIPALEQYIQRYPGTHQATEAVHNIARCMVQYADAAPLRLNEALELAIMDNNNTLIVAQIKLELGRYYWKEEHNPAKARRILQEVEAGPVPILADAAHLTLASLQK